NLLWRNDGEEERVWTVNGSHPIARGVPHPIIVPQQEMYGEMFDIPAPDELVFVSSFAGGEVFRSGAVFRRGKGKVFYFSPGDQEYPVYHQAEIQRVLANAVVWARPEERQSAPVKIATAPRGWFRADARDGAARVICSLHPHGSLRRAGHRHRRRTGTRPRADRLPAACGGPSRPRGGGRRRRHGQLVG